MEVCLQVLQAYESQLEPHFQFEEYSLLPLLKSNEAQPLVERTLADHDRLRDLLSGLRRNDAESLGSFGRCLTDHVRFEERELFPLLEDLLR
ncbi:hemerythrin HHE cation binding domain protein [mine drainage metagenome]|uniref:Hemerythrin HHE cation binding domain protein n=1 Tax=mine drainage metagenome TaxID=410659 RepID=A0A1J5ST50_9ZZZZ